MTEIIDKQVAGVSFGFYTTDDVLALSAAAIVHPHTFDSLHNPVASGLYDHRLGPLTPTDKCPTCGQGQNNCLGHMGHIRLTMPVYHPVLFDLLCKVMRGKCWWCHGWRVTRLIVETVRVKLELIEAGMLLQAQGLEEMERVGAATDEVRQEMRETVKREKEKEKARRLKERLAAKSGKKGQKAKKSGGAAFIDDEVAEDDDEEEDNDNDERMEEAEAVSSHRPTASSSRESQMIAHLARLSAAARNTYTRHLQLFGSPPQLTSAAIGYRSGIISSFLSALTAQRRCMRCGGYSPRLRKDGHSKLFRLPLLRKEREANEMSGKWEESAGVGGMGEQVGEVVPGMGRGEKRDFQREARIVRGVSAGKPQMNGHAMNGKANGKANGKMNGKAASKPKSATEAKRAAHKEKKAKRRNQQTTDSDEDTGGSSAESSGSSSSSSDSDSASDSDSDAEPSSIHSALLAEDMRASNMEIELAKEGKRVPILMFPTEVEKHLELLWQKENKVMQHIWGCLFNQPRSSPNQPASSALTHAMFFIRVLGVPPSRFRPPSLLNGQESDHPHNVYLKSILDFDSRIARLSEGRAPVPLQQQQRKSAGSAEVSEAAALDWSILIEQWLGLQEQVNVLLDSSKASQPNAPQDGIRQTFEKKEGLFRRNMMGKRVNYAARSVISPDPFLNTNEIGVPEMFATQLSFPEPVTAYNVEQLREAVINGPDVHPGANGIEDERGVVISLAHKTRNQRVALSKTLMTGAKAQKGGKQAPAAAAAPAPTPAKDVGTTSGLRCKRVLRHIRNGDVMLVNRQPTLHKPSMMTHRVRVLRGRNKMWQTIRMHYANCNTYNADFDGDEMNLHVPQSQLARAEAYHISNTDHQYLVPTDGSPLRGLIQDNVLTGVMLTQLDTWLTKAQFQQLLFCCIEVDPTLPLPTPVPALLKPEPRYSGKQLISTLLNLLTHGRPPLYLQSKAKVPVANWAQHSEEATVIIRGNDLVTGALDKSQFGDAGYGLVHAVYEMYGANTAGQLLSTLGRLFTLYLQTQAFTCGIDDMLIVGDSERKRHALIQDSITTGKSAAADFAGVKGASDDSTATNEALQRLVTTDPLNVARLDSAMKGALNPFTSDIIRSCLPSGQYKAFPYNGMSLMTLSGAKGSAVNFSQISCLLGQQELEGKRVPMMATGKTLPSFRRYDPQPRAGGYVTDRFLTGIRPQEYYFHCMAGREGLIDTAVKTSRSGYLQRCLIKHLESLTVNYDYTVRDSDLSIVQFHYGEDSIDIGRASYLEKFSFLASNWLTLIHKLHPPAAINALNTRSVEQYQRKQAKRGLEADPPLSVFSPGSNMGAVSEAYTAAVEKYITTDPDKLFSSSTALATTNKSNQPAITADKFRAVMSLNYLYSLVHPGESVGILAAQSVGEPSTQMTLNTFHLAGHGGANVTLGIPRLREIIMTASQRIRTPIMELPLLGKGGKDAAEEIAARLTRLTLSQFLYGVTVSESVDVREEGSTAWRLYRVRLEFPDMNSKVIDDARLTFNEFEQCFGHHFVVRLNAAVKKEVKAMSKSHALTPVIVKGKRGDRVEGEARDELELGGKMRGRGMRGDEDAVSAKERHKHDEDVSYAKPDEEDLEIIRRQEKEMEERETDEEEAEDEQERKKQQKRRTSTSERQNAGEEEDEENAVSNNDATVIASSDDMDERPWLSSILNRCSHIRTIHFDPKQRYAECTVSVSLSLPKLLMMGIAESIVDGCLLRSTPHIQRAFPIEKNMGDGTKEWRVGTDGVNFGELMYYGDVLDLDRMYSNDIYAVMQQYGVEAARTAITKEVQSVFAPYGISVDYRHLSLIADYMTVHGDYRALNRGGIDSSTSAFQKMTFETSMQFLTSAALCGDTDWMQSPSACIVMGKPVNCGTGSFELLQPLPM